MSIFPVAGVDPIVERHETLLEVAESIASHRQLSTLFADLSRCLKRLVAIHDNTHLYQPWEKPYYVLSIGDVYNMKTRAIEKHGTGVLVPPAIVPAK